MQTRHLLHVLVAVAATTPFVACSDDNEDKDTQAGDTGTSGDGDDDRGTTGDDERGTTGDGDGEPGETGDGDGDGDGPPGEGETAGEGEGETGGDGDGDALACQSAVEAIKAEFDNARCTTIVRFDYETFEPLNFDVACGEAPQAPLDEEMARGLSTCCKDGTNLSDDQDGLFLLYSEPAADKGGMSLISDHMGTLALEATIRPEAGGDYTAPLKWLDAKVLTTACAAASPTALDYDLTKMGEAFDPMEKETLLEAFSKTAVTDAILGKGDAIQRVVSLAYPRVSEPGNEDKTEYIVVVESETP